MYFSSMLQPTTQIIHMVCGLVKADSVSDHLFATACHINWNGLILSFYFYPVNVLHYNNCCFYTVCYILNVCNQSRLRATAQQ